MRTTGVRGAVVVAVVSVAALSGLAGLEAADADAATVTRQRYSIAITATTQRWEESRLPDGTKSGTWVHDSSWTARGTTVAVRRGARVSFVARIGGLLRTHGGIGRTLVRTPGCEAWAKTRDVRPARAAFRGDLRYYRITRRLASGRRVDVVRLLFTRRAPLLDPKLTEHWSATACSPEQVDSERTRLALPPSWVLQRPLAKHRALPAFRFGKRFVWRGVRPDSMPITVDLPYGGFWETSTRWTITFRPVRRR